MYPPGSTNENIEQFWPEEFLKSFHSILTLNANLLFKIICAVKEKYVKYCKLITCVIVFFILRESWAIELLNYNENDVDKSLGMLLVNAGAVELETVSKNTVKSSFIVNQIKTVYGSLFLCFSLWIFWCHYLSSLENVLLLINLWWYFLILILENTFQLFIFVIK